MHYVQWWDAAFRNLKHFNAIYIVPTAPVTRARKSLNMRSLYAKILHFILVFFQNRTQHKVSVKKKKNKNNIQFKTETIISESLTFFYAKIGRGSKGERKSIFLNVNPSSRCWGRAHQGARSDLALLDVRQGWRGDKSWPHELRGRTFMALPLLCPAQQPRTRLVWDIITLARPESQRRSPSLAPSPKIYFLRKTSS